MAKFQRLLFRTHNFMRYNYTAFNDRRNSCMPVVSTDAAKPRYNFSGAQVTNKKPPRAAVSSASVRGFLYETSGCSICSAAAALFGFGWPLRVIAG
jgi:hypothetical protein